MARLSKLVEPGVTTRDLDSVAEKFIHQFGASPSLKGYRGFPASICTSVNNVAAHGIPSEHALVLGDVLTIDTTILLDGWHGDAAWSFMVGDEDPDVRRLVRASWRATIAGIRTAEAGNRFGDIGFAIKNAAEEYGCTVFEDYVGHGIGRGMHEEPMVLNFGEMHTGLKITPGMVFTIEPIVSLGANDVRLDDDGWTIVTTDNSRTAQFEHTIAVFRDRTEVLTHSGGDLTDHLDFPPDLQ